MKKAVLLLNFIALFMFCGSVNAQQDSTVTNDDEIVAVVEQQATFPGGNWELDKFIRNNLVYPKQAKNNKVQGNVFVTFIVEKDGSISDIKILRDDIGYGCGKAAVDVVKKMPKWQPGKQRGKAVRQQFNLPIHFKL
ncbi:MAG: energy transducer TonB [Bacteroidales bacterium]|nr:energy transducer TonB [Bacteroidales bacterium]